MADCRKRHVIRLGKPQPQTPTKRIEKSGSGRTRGRLGCETCQLSLAANGEALRHDDNASKRRGACGQPLNAQRHARRHAGLVAIHLAVMTGQHGIIRAGVGRRFVRGQLSAGRRHGLIAAREHARIPQAPRSKAAATGWLYFAHSTFGTFANVIKAVLAGHSDHDCARLAPVIPRTILLSEVDPLTPSSCPAPATTTASPARGRPARRE
jgi:hypothetical protein